MELLTEIFSIFSTKKNKETKENYIYYKIVNFNKADNLYVMQCINSSSTFFSNIQEIVFDTDILHGLHPAQACYIGIEYAKQIKTTNTPTEVNHIHQQKQNKYSFHRYGLYFLSYQDRKGNICFLNSKTGESFLMDPRDIALSEELINEFDAAQAFYIGFVTGLKMDTVAIKNNQKSLSKYIAPKLKILK